MKHKNFNLYFDLENVFCEDNVDHTSLTVITATQKLSSDFNYRFSPGGHAGMADIMLSVLYPEYVPSDKIGDQDVYFNNLDLNIYILTAKDRLMIIMPNTINKKQYDFIEEYFNNLKKTQE